MARRVVIRSRKLNTAIAQLEEMVAAEYKAIWKDHVEELQLIAERIADDARALSPVDTGKLQASIKARVSRSPRYPGFIVQASAIKKGYDYALIQEENEDFHHEIGQAHYLSIPFYRHIDEFYFKQTGRHLEVPETPMR